jgi:hypothetical protein
MEVMAFLPTPAEIFPEAVATIEDLRDLQKNPVYQNMVQRLRGAAYQAGVTENTMVKGLNHAIEIMGYIEFEIQRAMEEQEPKEKTADEIGFEDQED